jgi:hypothetical protein
VIAKDLLNEVRDAHPSFDEEAHPNGLLLRRLSAIEQALFVRAVHAEEDVLTVTGTITAATLEHVLHNRQAIQLPSFYALRDVQAVLDGSVYPIEVVSAGQQRIRFPSLHAAGARIRLTDIREHGASGSGWQPGTSIRVRYVPSPARLTQMGQALTLPAIARDALTRGLEAFIGRRSPDLSSTEVARLERVAEAAEIAFLTALGEMAGHRPWRVVQAHRGGRRYPIYLGPGVVPAAASPVFLDENGEWSVDGTFGLGADLEWTDAPEYALDPITLEFVEV